MIILGYFYFSKINSGETPEFSSISKDFATV